MIAGATILGLATTVIGRAQSALEAPVSRLSARETELLGELKSDLADVTSKAEALAQHLGVESETPVTRLSVFHGYVPIVVVAFFVTLLATPIMRRLAVKHGVIDRPNEARKIHKQPIAYLGGAAVFLGIMAAIVYSFFAARFPDLLEFHPSKHIDDFGKPFPVPPSILLGITVIFLIGVVDDISGISPRVKVGGQLLAAAALAIDEVGTKLVAGFMLPIAKSLGIHLINLGHGPTVGFTIPLPAGLPITDIPIDIVYWIGTAVIAVSILGLCNASNLIDGLDGLLSGTTAIAAGGLLVLSLGLAVIDDGSRDSQRIVLCMALLGACLGFLPHNFNPATIFLGDSGSMLLGFVTCVTILTLGDTGKTHLVLAGLLIYSLPIMDMCLAIIRRKLAGKPISAADDQHLHHMLKRAFGVKQAVLLMYGIAAAFAVVGAGISLVRARSIYALGFFLVAIIAVYAMKIARLRAIEEQAAQFDAKSIAKPAAPAPAGDQAAATETIPNHA
jgi:UDP-GlcNAc:undecaprenyl-phosphate/decaprenyl-phosphate GlcNAc-1-phosphate transferase